MIDKGISGVGLLVSILTNKYQDHLPLYRQKKIFTREDIKIASSTIQSWTKDALIKLQQFYHQLMGDIKAKGYTGRRDGNKSNG